MQEIKKACCYGGGGEGLTQKEQEKKNAVFNKLKGITETYDTKYNVDKQTQTKSAKEYLHSTPLSGLSVQTRTLLLGRTKYENLYLFSVSRIEEFEIPTTQNDDERNDDEREQLENVSHVIYLNTYTTEKISHPEYKIYLFKDGDYLVEKWSNNLNTKKDEYINYNDCNSPMYFVPTKTNSKFFKL